MKNISWLKEHKFLVLILSLGILLRFYHLDFQSVWLDEIHTLNEANPNLSFMEMYDLIKVTEPHPPLYFILIKIAFSFFGYSTFVLRFFSALIGVIGIIAIYKLGKELVNKQVGIISALLLSLNYFHLYHSQDGRMYALLFLTTVISFYFFIKFLKNPNFKTGVLSGVFASLMIYTHFFALFALFAQYLILLFFVYKPYKTTSKKFLIYSLVSGVTTLVLYIPCFGLFFESTKRTSIWIPIPETDAFTKIFKEFVGNSELILFLIISVLLYYFIELFNKKSKAELHINPEEEVQQFSFFVLFTWIFVTLTIPLIISFVNLPMIVSRYFINVLPAFILMIAIGLFYIKSDLIKGVIISFLIIFSLTDIVVVKKYYKSISKSQFREASEFILEKNTNNEDVVTSLGWYFPFFLNNETSDLNIVSKSLDEKIYEMSLDSSKIKSFWYVDAHSRPFNPSDASSKFLEQFYFVDKSFDGFDAWVKHYKIKSDSFDVVDFNESEFLNKGVVVWFDTFEFEDNNLELNGWAYIDGIDSKESKIEVVLIQEDTCTVLPTTNLIRKDVTLSNVNGLNLDNSGFNVDVNLNNSEKGQYKVAVIVENLKLKNKGIFISDKTIEIIH